MADLGDGILLNWFDDKPAMTFMGQVDGQWYCLKWYEDQWAFYVSHDRLILTHFMLVPGDWEKYLFHTGSDRSAVRPPGNSEELVDAVKRIVREQCAKYRATRNPKDWIPPAVDVSGKRGILPTL